MQPKHLLQCVYPLCNRPSTHLIGACKLLAHKCSNCGGRGHHEDECGSYRDADFEDIYNHYRDSHGVVFRPTAAEREKKQLTEVHMHAFDYRVPETSPKPQDCKLLNTQHRRRRLPDSEALQEVENDPKKCAVLFDRENFKLERVTIRVPTAPKPFTMPKAITEWEAREAADEVELVQKPSEQKKGKRED